MSSEELTPMMRQYRRIKAELPEGVILLFRLGDFYEMFFEDARAAAPILGVALTQRAGTPMCGVPYHAIDAYLAKLIRAGKKAAICDQMEDPSQAKGIVRGRSPASSRPARSRRTKSWIRRVTTSWRPFISKTALSDSPCSTSRQAYSWLKCSRISTPCQRR